MGNNTTVVILNDFVGEIESDPHFPKLLADMLRTGQTGEVIPGVKIIETHHADYDVWIKVGGNKGEVLKHSLLGDVKKWQNYDD